MVRLFGDKALKDISNPHLFRLKEKMLQYKFTIRYLPGKHNAAADFLSKYPGARTDPDKVDEEQNTIAAATVASLDLSEHATLNEELVKQVAVEDPSYQLLVESVTNSDWGSYRAQELACLRPFYCVKNRLAVAGGLVTYTFGQGCVRLVIPEALRGQIAANLHASHQGLDSMLRRARQAIYWPGIEGDLQYHRASCNSCNANAPSQLPEPLLLTPPLEFPFQQTVANLQFGGQMYLVYADRLTGWLEIAHLHSGSSSYKIMKHFRHYFTRWGAPEQLSTDGGTNLVSEDMANFLKRWGVATRLSSAQYPQSSGRAEAAVKTAKRILQDNKGAGGNLDTDKMSFALLQYLNTPLRGVNKSPAKMTIGKQLRDGIPTARVNYKIDPQWRQTLNKRELQMVRQNEAALDQCGNH
nr:uncharacterized protein K02A2.6-like [Penaeus vannamei]